MSERQNIDRLFQEKFKDFEATPPEQVWSNIQSKISTDTKKTQPSLPSWLKLGGTAVALLIGLFLFDTVSNQGIRFLDGKSTSTEETATGASGSDKSNSTTTSGSITTTHNSEANTNQITTEENQIVSSDATSGKGSINSSSDATGTGTTTGNFTKENLTKEVSKTANSYSTKVNKDAKSGNSNTTLTNSTSKRGTFVNGVSSKNAYASQGNSSERKSYEDSKYSINAKAVKRTSNKATIVNRSAKINAGTLLTANDANAKQNSVSQKTGEVHNATSVLNPQNTSNQKAQTNGQIIANDTKTIAAQGKAIDNNKNAADNSIGLQVNKTESRAKNELQENSGDLLYENNAKSKIAYESGNRHLSQKDKNKTVVTDLKKENAAKNSEKESKTIADAYKGTDKAEKNNLNEKQINSALSSTDSIAAKQNTIAKNSEEKDKKEAEEEKDKKDNKRKDRWTISSSTTPVYMNLNGYGSTIDSKFDNNSKSYLTKMSYGAGVKYTLNEKWAVQTGVSLVNFEYNTNDITFYHSNRNAGLEHVTANSTGAGIVVENPDPKGIAYDNGGIVTTRYVGDINHRISYVEVPMQLNYKLLNKKFGIDVIGGISTLFLNENRVSVVAAETSINIGEANNLNRIHFSTNAGLGFHYNFMKALQVNFEPMFKYQIGTFKTESDNFKPYFIGLYSGISYKF